jgi:site-specific recombinase XerD
MTKTSKPKLPKPKALFPDLKNIINHPFDSRQYHQYLRTPKVAIHYSWVIEFLTLYMGSIDTYNAYRRDLERFCQWAWLFTKKPLDAIDQTDIHAFFEFNKKPPLAWIGSKNVSRFIKHEQNLIHNPEWCPFVNIPSKKQRMEHVAHQPSPSSMRALFATLSSFYNYQLQQGRLLRNPVQQLRQKKRLLQTQQQQRVTRKLSNQQWDIIIASIQQKCQTDARYERHLFVLAAFYLLGLRISELSETPNRIPKMGDFYPDSEERWWFQTLSKGNKLRDVAVPDSLLLALKRFRMHLNLSPLPGRQEQTPLIPKLKGEGGIGVRQLRYLVQHCFDLAIEALEKLGKNDSAEDIRSATVHWLRHTSISHDVLHRPREHVRDDAGHESTVVTDLYIETDRHARHASAQHKPLMGPDKPNETS